MEFEAYSVGLLSASVCTTLSIEEATARLNAECPTGIRSQWQPSADKTFSGGQPNPCDCNDHLGNKHYLFNC